MNSFINSLNEDREDEPTKFVYKTKLSSVESKFQYILTNRNSGPIDKAKCTRNERRALPEGAKGHLHKAGLEAVIDEVFD